MKTWLFFKLVRITKRLTRWAWQYEAVQIKYLKRSLDWYSMRCDKLQRAQQLMREPERTVVCDILANGFSRQDYLKKRVEDL